MTPWNHSGYLFFLFFFSLLSFDSRSAWSAGTFHYPSKPPFPLPFFPWFSFFLALSTSWKTVGGWKQVRWKRQWQWRSNNIVAWTLPEKSLGHRGTVLICEWQAAHPSWWQRVDWSLDAPGATPADPAGNAATECLFSGQAIAQDWIWQASGHFSLSCDLSKRMDGPEQDISLGDQPERLKMTLQPFLCSRKSKNIMGCTFSDEVTSVTAIPQNESRQPRGSGAEETLC